MNWVNPKWFLVYDESVIGLIELELAALGIENTFYTSLYVCVSYLYSISVMSNLEGGTVEPPISISISISYRRQVKRTNLL